MPGAGDGLFGPVPHPLAPGRMPPARSGRSWTGGAGGPWRSCTGPAGSGPIGVSNFLPHHLENLLEVCTVPPMVDQIEFHPGYVQWETVEFCRASQILVEAWSPLGRQRLADDPLLAELAGKYGVSQAQICLRFALDCGVVPLPKSADAGRMRQNLALGLCPGGGGLGAAADHAPDRLGPACTRTSEPAGTEESPSSPADAGRTGLSVSIRQTGTGRRPPAQSPRTAGPRAGPCGPWGGTYRACGGSQCPRCRGDGQSRAGGRTCGA